MTTTFLFGTVSMPYRTPRTSVRGGVLGHGSRDAPVVTWVTNLELGTTPTRYELSRGGFVWVATTPGSILGPLQAAYV